MRERCSKGPMNWISVPLSSFEDKIRVGPKPRRSEVETSASVYFVTIGAFNPKKPVVTRVL